MDRIAQYRFPLFFLLLAFIAGGIFAWFSPGIQELPALRIGVIHSLSGPMAISEKPLVDAVQLAVEEINAQGGLLQRPVAMVVADGRSDPSIFAREAERLISEEKVQALFACWTSTCRKAVKEVVERREHLLFYPVQYEGLEASSHIVYTGSTLNQQIIPGVRWAMEHLGPRFYLVGSDYLFPRVSNRIIHDLVDLSGGTILGERYLPLEGGEVTAMIEEIRNLKPDVVVNTINGMGNGTFFQGLQGAGLQDQPLLSFSVSEEEVLRLSGTALTRHYAVWSYFQSLPGEENRRFVAAFKERFGGNRVTSDPVHAAYVGVHLWAMAVNEAGSANPREVIQDIARQSMLAPSGILAVDHATRHLWKPALVGKVRADGQFELVHASSANLRPIPFPEYRSQQHWRDLLSLYTTIPTNFLDSREFFNSRGIGGVAPPIQQILRNCSEGYPDCGSLRDERVGNP